MSDAKEKVDSITYEILRHRLFSLLQEGRYAMARVSGSPVATEAKETLTSIYKPDGSVVLTAAGVFLHITGVRDEIRFILDNYSENPGIYEGDVFFFSDPYLGGIHANDIASITPLFHEGELIAWAAGLVHTAENGAIEPGGMPGKASEVYHDGICVPGLKVVEKGELRNDVICYLERATRSPAMMILDTKARNAATYAIRDGIRGLVERYGTDVLAGVFDRLIEEGEILAREKLKKLPDGTWSEEVYLDHDGLGYKLQKVKCAMTKEGDHISFDFSGSSPQNRGSANCALPGAVGSLYVALAGCLFWDVPWNEGMMRPVTMNFPEGSMVNCTFPASCAQAPPLPGIPISSVATLCISKMLAQTDEFRGDLNAAWATTTSWLSYGGIDQYGTRTGSMLMDPFAAGCGAGFDRDGIDSGGCQMTPESDCADAETYESAGPILYIFRKHRRDSAGPGKFRGGSGLEIAHMVHNTPGIYFAQHAYGEKTNPTLGIWGGYPAGSMLQAFLEDGEKVIEKLHAGKVPGTIEEGMEIEGSQKMPLFYGRMATEGMTGLVIVGGGGGYGDPLERDPRKVREDVESYIHSFPVAREVYGVVMDEKTCQIDEKATRKKRERIRKKRLTEGKALKAGKGKKEIKKMEKYFTEYLGINSSHEIQCKKCGYLYCDAEENYKEYALMREVTPSALGPLRPGKKDRDWCVYREFCCPGCGTLVQVDSLPANEAILDNGRPNI